MSLLLKAAPIIDKEIDSLRQRCDKLRQNGIDPSLKIVMVGEDPASVVYTNNKKRFSERVGIDCKIVKLPSDISAKEFSKIVDQINKDPKIHGQLIQLPLPEQLDVLDIDEIIVPEKDVDGFHHKNYKELLKGETGENGLLHCTPKGIVTLLKHYQLPISGRKITIIGRGPTVGMPLSLLLTNHNATVTLCHSKTENLRTITQKADIIISAIGRPKYLDKSFISPDREQILIDVGISRDERGKLSGDIDFENVKDFVSAITPVPGGVGPLTILSLAQNLILATELAQRSS